MRSFTFRKAKEEVEVENLRLRATKTVLASQDGDGPAAPYLRPSCKDEIKRKGKRKERAAAADSCCGRIMSAKQASADCPSDPGSTGLRWAGRGTTLGSALQHYP